MGNITIIRSYQYLYVFVTQILLISGNAGKGKSTLANVLTGTNEFEESTDPINGTSKTKAKEFEHEKIKYRIIDTVGIGISIQSTEEILNKLKGITDILSEGINRILFLTNGRFTKEEVEAFNLLRNVIFDDRVTDYTTIVFTNFAKFKDEKACEKNRQGFQQEIGKISMPLASTAIIYVDNPPIIGFMEPVARISREASREVLLNHLRTCQEVYQPEPLKKFRKMLDEFNSIIKDTIEAVENVDLYYKTNITYLGEFITTRRVIIENIEERLEEVRKYMGDRFKSSVVSHSTLLIGKGLSISGIWFPPLMVPGLALSTIGFVSAATTDISAILKENEAYKSFEESLAKDKEKCENLEILQEELRNLINKFKDIRPRFVISEYRKQNIDRNKIEVIENVMNQILGEEIEPDVDLNNNEKTKYSTSQETVRAVVEGICKLAPSPLSFYCMYRDHKETKNRDSLSDMEMTIKDFREGLKVLEEKQQQLNELYETIKRCEEKIAKLT
ncbi:hypothetical protein RhiirA1_440354 [Rhizophagus irregularis]|uniref:AIG1-type G domain-containing protein n=2 Tax=Rhizophagus irregularis TaxID=588596 RepID=A0A2N0RZV9_9GLOM|nr:hypothetical protein RhiirA1_440354 [Rhizophagus irregularis]